MNEKYREAVKTIKTAILKSQNRAAKHTNAEMLSLYYGIGGYVSLAIPEKAPGEPAQLMKSAPACVRRCPDCADSPPEISN